MSTLGLMEPTVTRVSSAGRKPKAGAVHPAPLVRARAPIAADPVAPGGMASIRKLAETAGWTVSVTYSLGYLYPSEKLAHSYALRMSRGSQSAIATWVAGAELVRKERKVKGIVVQSMELAWSFDFAGGMGAALAPVVGDDRMRVESFPYSLNSAELRGLVKSKETALLPLMDCQYGAVSDAEKRSALFIRESGFRSLVNPPKIKNEVLSHE